MENNVIQTKNFLEIMMDRLFYEWGQFLIIHKDISLKYIYKKDFYEKNCRVVIIQNNTENYQHIAIIVQEISEEYVFFPQIIKEFIIEIKDSIEIITKNHYEDIEEFHSKKLIFTGNVYLYTNSLKVSEDILREYFQKNGLFLILRDEAYWDKFWKRKNPDAFMCYDSRDGEFARSLYNLLSKRLVKIWYDEFSLKIGDSIIKKIEQGLQLCKYAIIIVSKNFLSNVKWAEREFRSLLHREIRENRKLILPVWLDVSEEDVLRYSLYLIDKYAINASEGIEAVAENIIRVLRED